MLECLDLAFYDESLWKLTPDNRRLLEAYDQLPSPTRSVARLAWRRLVLDGYGDYCNTDVHPQVTVKSLRDFAAVIPLPTSEEQEAFLDEVAKLAKVLIWRHKASTCAEPAFDPL